MKKLILPLAVFILTFVVGFFASCDNKQSNGKIVNNAFDSNVVVTQTPDNKPVSERTEEGIAIKSTGPVSQVQKDRLDRSVLNAIEDAKALGFTKVVNPRELTIEIKQNCELSPEQHTPSWRILAPNYNNTEWDINPDPNVGEVYAAELVKQDSRGNIIPEYIICNSEDAEYTSNAGRFGYEHIAYYYNNKAKYNETATHLRTGHPILPSRNQ